MLPSWSPVKVELLGVVLLRALVRKRVGALLAVFCQCSCQFSVSLVLGLFIECIL